MDSPPDFPSTPFLVASYFFCSTVRRYFFRMEKYSNFVLFPCLHLQQIEPIIAFTFYFRARKASGFALGPRYFLITPPVFARIAAAVQTKAIASSVYRKILDPWSSILSLSPTFLAPV